MKTLVAILLLNSELWIRIRHEYSPPCSAAVSPIPIDIASRPSSAGKDRAHATSISTPYTLSASSRYRQNPFAILICLGVLHSGSNSAGLPTRTQMALAREVATLKRWRL